MALTKKLHSYLSTKRHDNGYPVAKIYGRGWDEGGDQGDILNFNLLRDDGSFVGFVEVIQMLPPSITTFFRQRRCAICLELK